MENGPSEPISIGGEDSVEAFQNVMRFHGYGGENGRRGIRDGASKETCTGCIAELAARKSVQQHGLDMVLAEGDFHYALYDCDGQIICQGDREDFVSRPEMKQEYLSV